MKEFIGRLEQLQAYQNELEDAYVENGGEMTDDTAVLEGMEAEIAKVLEKDVDALGRWLKAVGDEKASLKAEKDYLARRIAAKEETEDFVKFWAGQALRALGKDKVKGENGYSFAQYTSHTVKADTAALKERYQQRALDAIHAAGIPACVTLTLGASSSLVPEGAELPDFFTIQVKETSKFSKPRASKAAKEE